MRDYKFSHSTLDFDQPKRPIGRWLSRIAIAAIVLGCVYLAYVGIDWGETKAVLPGNDDPNVIPLEIPPSSLPAAPAGSDKDGG